jgi:hypothetical protein
MAIVDPAPDDGTEPLEVSVIKNFFALESKGGKLIYVDTMLVYHSDDDQEIVEGYMQGSIFAPYARAFVEQLPPGNFEFIGTPTDRECLMQEYEPGAKVKIGREEYKLLAKSSVGPMMMRKTFGSQTHLWRQMEGYKRGTAQWQYAPDFSNIRLLGPERPMSNPLTSSDLQKS